MRLRVESKLGSDGWPRTRVVNAETGEPIEHVTSVTWTHPSANDASTLTMEVLFVDAEIEQSGKIPVPPSEG